MSTQAAPATVHEKVTITDIKVYQLKGHGIQSLIRVQTDQGVEGIGEAGLPALVVQGYLDFMREWLIGQNALPQVETFRSAAPVSGLFLAKMDGTARGGFVFAVRRKFPVPVKFVGVGEGMDDVERFDPDAFVDAILADEASSNG